MRASRGAGGGVGAPVRASLFTLLLAAAALPWALSSSGTVGAMPVQEAADSFPHQEHEGLFPLCTGCHQGVESGDPGDLYPEAGSCAGCHDGVELARVGWSPPGARPSLLRFDHPDHRAELVAAGDEPADCRSCHGGAAGARMDLEPLDAGRCLDCHEDEAGDTDPHLGGEACATCHVTAAASGLPGAALADLPVPASHEAGDFIMPGHGRDAPGRTATCATCHVQERCTSCHVVADDEAIRALPQAPASMELPVVAAHYPVPTDHAATSFGEEHGRGLDASDVVASCATCHTRDDCASCHVETGTFLAGLPRRGEVPAPGVGLLRQPPPSHRSPFFLDGHPTLASADPGSCATCHEPPSCAACHDAPGPAAFHPDNFVARHASASFGGASECANCHDTERFCRSCHLQAGLGSTGRLGPGYHDAEPVWLLRHGQAARQELESCASCHRQNECLQCHSQSGAFRVSPHRPGFDARRAFERNPVICTACHLRSPFGSGGAP